MCGCVGFFFFFLLFFFFKQKTAYEIKECDWSSDVCSSDLNGLAPTKKNIGTGKYPLVRPLYLTVALRPSKMVRDFIKFALSDEGQAIISKQGTVNLKEKNGTH